MRKRSWWYHSTQRLSPAHACLWIALSLLLVTGPAALLLVYSKHLRQKQLYDYTYWITTIAQNGPLSSIYLAELIALSVDRPTNLYALSRGEAERRLMLSPLIVRAHVKHVAPATLVIDYAIRKPVAKLRDFSNSALTEDGVVIPYAPFFADMELPEVYLGLTAVSPLWGTKIDDKARLLLVTLQQLLQSVDVAMIDLSHRDEKSCGQSQLIITLRDEAVGGTLFLRLSVERFEEEITRYLRTKDRELAPHITQGVGDLIVDMRIEDLALIRREEDKR